MLVTLEVRKVSPLVLSEKTKEENNFYHFLEDSTEGEPFSLFAGFLVLVMRGTNWHIKAGSQYDARPCVASCCALTSICEHCA